MVSYRVVFTKQAQKDAKRIGRSNLKGKASVLIEILKKDPYQSPPHYESLLGDLSGAFPRRINIQHRLIYQVIEDEKTVKVLRMWTHYGD